MRDIINLIKYDLIACKTAVIVVFSIIAFIFISSIILHMSFFVLILCITPIYVAIVPFVNDGKGTCRRTYGILPIKHRNFVFARYILMAVVFVTCLLFGICTTLIINTMPVPSFLHGDVLMLTEMDFETMSYMISFYSFFIIALMSIYLALCFRFSYEAASFVLMGIFIVICIIIYFVFSVSSITDSDAWFIMFMYFNDNPVMELITLLSVLFLIVYISCCSAVHAVEKREF